MATPVELPSEVNPLTRQNLLNALLSAASSTQQQVHEGTKQLQYWEKKEGFYPLLQDVFLDHSLPLEIRYLSIIQIKNGIDKYWRKTAAHAIKKEDKETIKRRALEAGIVEPAPLLALHNALTIAKVLRHELTSGEWPDALPFLISALRESSQPGANPLQLPRTLTILLQIIKELSTARIQRIRQSLLNASPEILQVLGNIYVDKVNSWGSLVEQGHADETAVVALLEQSLTSIKVLRRLLVAGYEHPNRDEEVRRFWELSYMHVSKFFTLVDAGANRSAQIRKYVGKHLLQLSKLHVEMCKVHPAAFALLPNSITLVQSYWTVVVKLGEIYEGDISAQDSHEDNEDVEDESRLIDRIGLKALLLLRACAKMAFYPANTFKYQYPQDKEERKQSIELVKSQLFTQEFVINVMELLVSKFLRLRRADLQEWEHEPEEWEKKEDQISEAWEFSIRSCSEKLFLDLITHFKALLIPQLLNVFYSFANPQNRDILMKDSLYAAVGLAAPSLEEQLDFNAFIESTLVPEVQIQEQGYKILRRRTAIMLGQWLPMKPDSLNRDFIYQIFQHLLNKEDPLNDLVVRITTGRQLKNILEPFEFSPQSFLPYATPILQNLMNLIREVELSETKMALLETVRIAVERMEDHILPFSDDIMGLLPLLWEQAGEEHLLKQAILTILSSLMSSLKGDSVKYHGHILPLIRNAIEPGSEAMVYLLEEALNLWHSIVMQTPAPASPEVLSLLPGLFPILADATDSTALGLSIAESYVLLAPQEVLSDHIRLPLLASLEKLLSSTSGYQRLGVVPRLVEMIIRATATVDGGSENSYRVIASSLLDSCILQALLDGLYSAYEASQSTGPNRKTSHVYGVLETEYFSVLARLAIASPRVFFDAISRATGTSVEQILSWLLKEWFFHYDNIGLVTQKKLHTMALTQLLTINQNTPNTPPPAYLLNHLQDYLTIWTNIITELSEGMNDPDKPNKTGDYLIHWSRPDPAVAENYELIAPAPVAEPPENTRLREWDNADIIHQINIRDFVKERLQMVIEACGGPQRFQEDWLINVDREVVSAFGALGIL